MEYWEKTKEQTVAFITNTPILHDSGMFQLVRLLGAFEMSPSICPKGIR